MATFFGLDIPEGLEEAYYKIISVVTGTSSLNFKHRPSGKSIVRRGTLASISLFVLWEDLYNGFDGTRKSAWTSYWGTLPFGSHSGAGGWPGSGFSAFVYVNAPRYKAGLDLLLDPPEALGPELVTNGAFDGNADGWVLDYGDNPFVYDDHGVLVSTDDLIAAYLRQTIPLVDEGDYRLQFDLAVSRSEADEFLAKFAGDSSFGGWNYPVWYGLADPGDMTLTHVSYDAHFFGISEGEEITLQLGFFSGEVAHFDIFITNVSVRQIL